MQTHQLQRNNPNMKRMTVARGGKRGKTAGRGGKGQSARAGNKRRPEWRDIIKRLPKLRGRGKNSNKSFYVKPFVINLSVIDANFTANSDVNPSTLVEKGIVSTFSGKVPAVKILGEGEITKAVKVSGCDVSGSAREKILKAGGSAPEPKVVAKPVVKPEAKTEAPKAEKKEKPEAKKSDKKAESAKPQAKVAVKKEVKEKVATKK